MALKILESGIYSHNKMFVLLECIEHTQLLHLFINMIPRLDLKIILRTFQNLRISILHKPKIDPCLGSSRQKINELKIPQSKRYSCLKVDGHEIEPDFVRIGVNLTKPGRIGMYLDTK